MSDAVTREEILLNAIATGEAVDIVPVTRKEKYLRYLAGIGEKPSKPITREEMFLDKIQAGGGGGEDEASMLDSLIDGSITEMTSNVESVREQCFYYCGKLKTINLPNATTVNRSAFDNCTSLTTLNIPKLTSINQYAFQNCYRLKMIKFPFVTGVGAYAFYRCSGIQIADFSVLTSSIGMNAFNSCSALKSFILRTGTMVSLSSINAFSGTPIASGTGYIYVPSALVDTYKSATNWSTYATQFRALENYTVDGTITGELDESKI